jgi:hypothetical protein
MSLKLLFCLHGEQMLLFMTKGGRRGRDRMVVGFTAAYTISAYQH